MTPLLTDSDGVAQDGEEDYGGAARSGGRLAVTRRRYGRLGTSHGTPSNHTRLSNMNNPFTFQ